MGKAGGAGIGQTIEYGFKSDGLASRLWLSTISAVSGVLAPKISHALMSFSVVFLPARACWCSTRVAQSSGLYGYPRRQAYMPR